MNKLDVQPSDYTSQVDKIKSDKERLEKERYKIMA